MMQRKNNKRSKPYKHLTAVQKQSICKCKKDNPDISYIDLAKNYGVGKTTIQNIISQSKKWLDIDINTVTAQPLRNKPPKWPSLEQALWLWTTSIVENNLPLTGETILVKARDYAEHLCNRKLIIRPSR